MLSMTLSRILSTNHKFSVRRLIHWRVVLLLLLLLLPALSLLAWNALAENALPGLPETKAKAAPLDTATSTSTPTITPTFTPTSTPACGPNSNYVASSSTGATIVSATTDRGNRCDDCTIFIALP